MSSSFRLRERVLPVPGKTVLKWGDWYCEVSPGNWKKYDSYSSANPWPFYSAESCLDQLHPGPPYMSGGPFRSVKITNMGARYGLSGGGTYVTNFKYSTPVGYGKLKFVGSVIGAPLIWKGGIDSMSMAVPWLRGDANTIPSTTSLESMVWDKTKPKIEQGGLFVAIAEARDVPRMMTNSLFFHEVWKELRRENGLKLAEKMKWAMSPAHIGDQFLNVQFGWKPFIKDISAFIDNILNANDKIQRLKAENGSWVKRRAILVNQQNESSIKDAGIFVNFQGTNDFYAIDGQGRYMSPHAITRTVTNTYAYSVGRFRYYLPEFSEIPSDRWNALNTLKQHLAIHGARINPSNLYKATPWTWLIDWVSDTGKTIQAIQDQTMDNMAAKYLYLCHRMIKTVSLEQYIPFNAESGGPRTFIFPQVIACKQRKEADSPFGFGLGWENLSPGQLATLGALGLSRVR